MELKTVYFICFTEVQWVRGFEDGTHTNEKCQNDGTLGSEYASALQCTSLTH